MSAILFSFPTTVDSERRLMNIRHTALLAKIDAEVAEVQTAADRAMQTAARSGTLLYNKGIYSGEQT